LRGNSKACNCTPKAVEGKFVTSSRAFPSFFEWVIHEDEFRVDERGAFDSAKNHKRQRRKRQSVTAKREKSQTPKFV